MLAMLLAVLTCGDLCGDEAIAWYVELLGEGGYGRFERERAAFLIRERDGRLTLAPWEVSGDRHASFEGHVPERTIAIVHTHPRRAPNPSAHDRAEARRLAIPVLVITPDSVVAVSPDGTQRTLATNGWSARRERQAALEK